MRAQHFGTAVLVVNACCQVVLCLWMECKVNHLWLSSKERLMTRKEMFCLFQFRSVAVMIVLCIASWQRCNWMHLKVLQTSWVCENSGYSSFVSRSSKSFVKHTIGLCKYTKIKICTQNHWASFPSTNTCVCSSMYVNCVQFWLAAHQEKRCTQSSKKNKWINQKGYRCWVDVSAQVMYVNKLNHTNHTNHNFN